MSAPETINIFAETVQPVRAHESGLRDLALLGKLWPFIRPYLKPLLTSLFLLVLVTLTMMIQPFIIKWAIDGPVAAGNLEGLVFFALVFLGLLILHYGVRYVQMYLAQMTGQRIIRDIRTQLYAHLQTLTPRFYQANPVGKLVTRVTSDVENLSEMLSSGGFAILTDVALILGAAIGMLLMEWRLALMALGMLAVMAVMMEYFRAKTRKAYDEIRVKVAWMNAFLQENLAGMELVQLYQREQKNYALFEGLNRSNLKSGLDSVFYNMSFNAAVEFLTYVTMILVLWFGGQAILQGEMTYGLLAAFFQFVKMMFEPVEDVSEKYTILQSGLSSIDKVMVLFKQEAEVQSPEAPQPLPSILRGEIVFDQVHFGYLADQAILKGVSFQVRPGEKIAIVGPTGAGKSTIIKLLLRYYDVDAGRILLDGLDIRTLSLVDLRKTVVSIHQDDVLFSRTVAENIAFEPLSEANRERLYQAAASVNALGIIERLPKGFEEILTEQGRNLSAGERQLLLFARAVYHDPAVLVLDEATSAVDPHTETLVQEAMDRLTRDRTVLVIAHRLSTIQKADRILVIEDGCLAESGSHEALLEKNGLYAKFYQYQQALEAV